MASATGEILLLSNVMISGDEQQAVVFKVQSRRGKAEVLNPLRSNLVLLTLAAEGNIAGKGKKRQNSVY